MGVIELLKTNNGREFITPKQVESEIHMEVERHGGRKNLTDLCIPLALDINLLEEGAQRLIKANEGLFLSHGELITSSYLDSFAVEVSDLLQESGTLTVGDISQRFDMPTDLVESALTRRISSGLLQAQARPGKFYTHGFVQQQRAKIRGVLRGTTSPVSLSTIVNTHGFEKEMLRSTVDEMIAQGSLPGQLSGSKNSATYTPTVYKRGQQGAVSSFFKQNGYVEFSRLKKVGIHDPAKHMQQLGKGILLDTCAISESTIDTLEGVVAEAKCSGSWVRISDYTPSCLTKTDSFRLMQKLPAVKGKGVLVYDDEWVVAAEVMTQCQTKLSAHISANAAKEATVLTRNTSTTSVTSQQSSAPSEKGNSKKKKGGSKKKRKGDVSSDDESEEEGKTRKGELLMKREEGKEKKGRRAKGKKGKGVAADEPETSSDNNNSTLFGMETISGLLPKWFSEMEDEDELIALLAEQLVPFGQAEFTKMKESIWSGSVASRRKRHEMFTKAVESCISRLQLFAKGLAAVSGDAEPMELCLCKDFGNELVNEVVLIAAHDAGIESVEGMNSSDVTPASRQELLVQLEAKEQKLIKAVLEARTAESLTDSCQAICDAFDVYIKPLDKKTERSAVHAELKQIEEQLRNQEDPAGALLLIVQLLHVKESKSLLYCTNRCLNEAISLLCQNEAIAEELREQIKAFGQMVTKHHSLGEEAEEQQQVATELEAELVLLKAAVFPKDK